MAKTKTSSPNSGERGFALLEAAVALAIVALLAAAGFTAFAAANRAAAVAEARLTALAAAENALELASAPAVLRRALEDGEAALEGEGWRVVATPYADDDGEGPLALVSLVAEAGETAPVRLETLRSLPR